jgi:hypothetical protein
VTIFLACLSAAALIVSVVAVGYSRNATAAADRSAIAAERSADAAQSSDRLSRVPQLDITLIHPAPPPSDKAIYRLRNDGPQDLSAVTIFRPRPPDRITYPLAVTGLNWAEDEITFPLKIADYKEITFCCGVADQLPEFRVRIECESGQDGWPLTKVLPPPRGDPRPRLGADPARARSAIETARGYFQEAVSHGGKDQSFWLDPDRKGTGQELRDNAERIDDPQLRSAIEGIAATWDDAWASSPRGQVTVLNLNAPIEPEDPARLAQFHASESAAQEGLVQCASALAIFNGLEAGSR